jgi:hypothetical protein
MCYRFLFALSALPKHGIIYFKQPSSNYSISTFFRTAIVPFAFINIVSDGRD